MPAQLVALTDGPDILLDKPVMLLGRHVECDVQLNSRKVSRRHCCIAQVHDYLVVRDLGSTNGVRINGDRVVEGVLRPGDELTIGNFRYKIQPDAAKPTPGGSGSIAAADALRRTISDSDLENASEPVPLTEAPESQILLARKPPVNGPEPAAPASSHH